MRFAGNCFGARLCRDISGCWPAGSRSGSTFVYPVLAKWSEAYQRTRGIHVEYQPIGSSGGLTEIRAGVVDLGVSDAPLTPDQLLRDGLAQFRSWRRHRAGGGA